MGRRDSRSQISGEDRARRWPAAFSTKGLRATYAHKGQASKTFDNASKLFKYTVIFGQENVFGHEDASFNLPERVNRTAHGGNQTELGLTAQVQSTDYDFDDAAAKPRPPPRDSPNFERRGPREELRLKQRLHRPKSSSVQNPTPLFPPLPKR